MPSFPTSWRRSHASICRTRAGSRVMSENAPLAIGGKTLFTYYSMIVGQAASLTYARVEAGGAGANDESGRQDVDAIVASLPDIQRFILDFTAPDPGPHSLQSSDSFP